MTHFLLLIFLFVGCRFIGLTGMARWRGGFAKDDPISFIFETVLAPFFKLVTFNSSSLCFIRAGALSPVQPLSGQDCSYCSLRVGSQLPIWTFIVQCCPSKMCHSFCVDAFRFRFFFGVGVKSQIVRFLILIGRGMASSRARGPFTGGV